MTEFKPEFWNRNAEGELIPQHFSIPISKEPLLPFIEDLKKKEALEIDDKKKLVLKRAIELLNKEYEDSKLVIEADLIPLVSGEIKCLNKSENTDCSGLPTVDQEADICARKCKLPKYSFNEWRDMKDARVKNVIANKIREISFPKQSENVKEVFQMLREL